MAVETNIIGFITFYGEDREHNEKILKEIDYDVWKFADMFCIPNNTGSKGSDYIFFGAGYSYLNFEEWLGKFESVLKRLKTYKAFLFVDKELSNTFAIGYNLYDEHRLVKEEIDFGNLEDYCSGTKFPFLFEVMKYLKNRHRPTVNNIDDIWGKDDDTI